MTRKEKNASTTATREDLVHWNVSNEMLHFDFYEQRLRPNALITTFLSNGFLRSAPNLCIYEA